MHDNFISLNLAYGGNFYLSIWLLGLLNLYDTSYESYDIYVDCSYLWHNLQMYYHVNNVTHMWFLFLADDLFILTDENLLQIFIEFLLNDTYLHFQNSVSINYVLNISSVSKSYLAIFWNFSRKADFIFHT